jgi:GNAT superfamily N-acetyltransferase
MRCSQKFVELDKSIHERSGFDCGEVNLNTFIKQQALRHMSANVSRTMVLPAQEQINSKHIICAFYTITPSSITRKQLPKAQAKKLPHYPIPVFLLAQLAVDKKQQGTGLGKITLVKALEHLYRINTHMRAYAVVVDCLNKNAESFYKQFGFEVLFMDDNGRVRLFLSMKQLGVLFGK